MKVPDWYAVLLLGLASWRTYHLLAYDDILDPLRRRVLRLGKEWKTPKDQLPPDYRLSWALFLTCPYCAGFWISLVWYGAWQITSFWTLVVAAVFVLNTAVIAASKVLDQE